MANLQLGNSGMHECESCNYKVDGNTKRIIEHASERGYIEDGKYNPSAFRRGVEKASLELNPQSNEEEGENY